MANTVWYLQPAPFGMPAQWVKVANITGGPKGAKGDKGDRGPVGSVGPAGLQGTSGVGNAWTTGAGAPVAAGTVSGDMYLNTLNGDVYRWSGSAWIFQTNIDGPTGSTGPTGPIGSTGQQGTGATGQRGQDGATWLIGNAQPVATQGKLGDYFFQLAPNPTAATLIKGDQGPAGPVGLPGPPGQLTTFFTKVHFASDTSIANTTNTAVIWNVVDADTPGAWSSASNTRLTAKKAGWYILNTSIHWAAGATLLRVCDFRVNGSTFLHGNSFDCGGTVNDCRASPMWFYYLAAGDYVEVIVWQNSGGALNITAPCQFSMIKVAD